MSDRETAQRQGDDGASDLAQRVNEAKGGASKGRGALAIAGGAALVLSVAAASFADAAFPAASSQPTQVPAVQMPVGDARYVCAPTLRLTGKSSGTDDAYEPGAAAASSTVRSLILGDRARRLPGAELLDARQDPVATILPRVEEEEAQRKATRDASGLSGVNGKISNGTAHDDALWLAVQALGGTQHPAAGVRTVEQADGDLAGLATPSCVAPSNSLRLVGASTTVGHSAVLVVTNPSKVSATVRVDVSTAEGPATEAPLTPFVLEAGKTRAVNLGAVAPDADGLNVEINAAGAPVGASIAQTMLRGLTPGGIDTIQPSTASTTNVMPGVQLQDAAESRAVGATDAAGESTPEVVIADASGHGTTATVLARAMDGKETVVSADVKVPQRGTVAVPLDGLPAGRYTIVVRSQEAAASTTRVLRGSDPKAASDVAYVPSAARVSAEQLVALPATVGADLVLSSPEGAAKVSLTPIGEDGKPGQTRSVEVPAGGGVSVPSRELGAGALLSASGDDVYASVLTVKGKDRIASELVPAAPEMPSSTRVELTP